MRGPIEVRMSHFTEVRTNGCHEWTGCIDYHGYGQVWFEGKTHSVHRLTWALAYGPIADEIAIRHFVCDNPLCRNLEHLKPGTQADNIADRDAKGRHRTNGNEKKTHCKRMHLFDEANTYVRPTTGWRKCRVCANLNLIEHRKNKKVGI